MRCGTAILFCTATALFCAATALFYTATALAQHVTSIDKLPPGAAGFATRQTPLPCTVTAIKPVLNLGLQFQTGYVVRTPLEPYAGAQHHWQIVFDVTPEDDATQPVYFIDQLDLPAPPHGAFEAEAAGAFLVGEGRYGVRWSLFDDLGRVCRQQWTIDAHLTNSERLATASMPASVAGDLSWQPAAAAPAETAPVATRKERHVTILLNSALPIGRQAQSADVQWNGLLSIVTALMERMQGVSVRLIVFNLDQQREVFREENFTLGHIDQVAHAANGLTRWAVDSSVLAKPAGGWDLLRNLENGESKAPVPADTVIFLGLPQRDATKMPDGMPESGQSTRYFYLEDRAGIKISFSGGANPTPFSAVTPGPGGLGGGGGARGGGGGRGGGPNSLSSQPSLTDEKDPIRQAVQRLKGKTMVVSSPATLSKAIAVIRQSTRP